MKQWIRVEPTKRREGRTMLTDESQRMDGRMKEMVGGGGGFKEGRNDSER